MSALLSRVAGCLGSAELPGAAKVRQSPGGIGLERRIGVRRGISGQIPLRDQEADLYPHKVVGCEQSYGVVRLMYPPGVHCFPITVTQLGFPVIALGKSFEPYPARRPSLLPSSGRWPKQN
jgi:hypothetical protein